MTEFKTLVNIDSNLRDLVKEIERYFNISVDKELVNKIYKDTEEDQVSEKTYLIFDGEKRGSAGQLIILGTVDEYEPETIWIEIKNIRERDSKHFNGLISGEGHVR